MQYLIPFSRLLSSSRLPASECHLPPPVASRSKMPSQCSCINNGPGRKSHALHTACIHLDACRFYGGEVGDGKGQMTNSNSARTNDLLRQRIARPLALRSTVVRSWIYRLNQLSTRSAGAKGQRAVVTAMAPT